MVTWSPSVANTTSIALCFIGVFFFYGCFQSSILLSVSLRLEEEGEEEQEEEDEEGCGLQ